jgi:hypothetical protein
VIISITFDPAFDFFLAKSHEGGDLAYPLTRHASVKDIIESSGVPHTEVGRICFNDQDIDFSFIPDTPGKLDIHAVDAPFDVGSPSLLRPEPLDRVRFVADVNVLKLGRLLILLGFDVACSSSFSDQEIADLSESESRIVLTRDTTLLKRRKIVFGGNGFFRTPGSDRIFFPVYPVQPSPEKSGQNRYSSPAGTQNQKIFF